MLIILVNYGMLNYLLLKIQDNEKLAGVIEAGILVDIIKNGNAIMDAFIVMRILMLGLTKPHFTKFN